MALPGPLPSAVRAGRLLKSLRGHLPRGGTLPPEEWERRHRTLMAVLWVNALALPAYGLAAGGYGVLHELAHGAPLLALALLAGSARFGAKLRSLSASVGLLGAAALLVHLTDGLIEAHFYFFVLVMALTVYEDWLAFLAAVLFVLLHHGIVGTLLPQDVYNHPDAWADPWPWAGIHALFVAFAGSAGILAWRLNESVRERMRVTQAEIERMAETDSLTGLPNRRKAIADLALYAERAAPCVVMVLDLDGFKSYNDSFGHSAGDALLARLGQRLSAAIGARGTAYRLGGDEFWVIAPGSRAERSLLEVSARAALVEESEAFSITASYGSALVPAEARTPAEGINLADQRMYAGKQTSRPSAQRQSKDVLRQALAERHPDIGGHVDNVAELAGAVGSRLGMKTDEIAAVRIAAELHDIGKVAIPDTIVGKLGPLDEEEWSFMRRHTVIGQRIVEAAPVLAGVGDLIRSSHEAWNGGGYPDGLRAGATPLGARVIAVCDAYDSMTSDRPYRQALSPAEARAELRRCAGGQFDPQVVAAFEAVAREEPELGEEAASLARGAVA